MRGEDKEWGNSSEGERGGTPNFSYTHLRLDDGSKGGGGGSNGETCVVIYDQLERGEHKHSRQGI